MPSYYDYLLEKFGGDNDPDEINRRLLELSSLFEISRTLNASLELSHILNNVLLIPMGRLLISRGLILLIRDSLCRVELAKGIREPVEHRTFPAVPLPEEAFEISALSETQASASELIPFLRRLQLQVGIPFISRNRVLGYVFYGNKLSRQPFSEAELNFLTSLANIGATAIQNALQLEEIRQVNRELDEKIQQLKTIFDIGEGLLSTLDEQEILKILCYSLAGQMTITRYAVVLNHPRQGYQLAIHKGYAREALRRLEPAFAELFHLNEATHCPNISHPQARQALEDAGVAVIIPMHSQGKCLGVVLLGPKVNGQPFRAVDLEFLTTLVNQAAISLENARLFRETLEKQRIEEELNVARTIQMQLLPKQFPHVPGYAIHGLNLPSKQVGGDYFDIIQIAPHRIALAIGDVTGKSVPAALLMANLQSALRIMIGEDIPLPRIVARLNRLIYQNTEADKFITFFIGILNTRNHAFTYVNAGHNYPLWCRRGRLRAPLTTGGIILGIMEEAVYEADTIYLEPGDVLLAYTDGITEATNPQGEETGEAFLETLLEKHHQLPLPELFERIIQEIHAFSAGAAQQDDITLLGLKRLDN
ncbi:MAG: SpoIIE family protein phosphatase [Calditrichaeota bacterium]|nr:SpoIIE family protein phosphatase [Calditrichota bacterium]